MVDINARILLYFESGKSDTLVFTIKGGLVKGSVGMKIFRYFMVLFLVVGGLLAATGCGEKKQIPAVLLITKMESPMKTEAKPAEKPLFPM